MNNVRLAICMGILASVASSACDKGSGSGGSPATTTTASAAAMTPPAATTTTAAATTTAAVGAAKLSLSGTCTTKAGARMLDCTEYYGKLPDGVEDSCKKNGGTYAAGATPCVTTDSIGKCASAGTSAASQTVVSYKTSVGDAKGSCEALGNTWTAAAK